MAEVESDELRRVVEKTHGGAARLVRSVSVSESVDGTPAWSGLVHVFQLLNHPNATRAYAWSSPIAGSRKRGFFTALRIPPILEPVDAIRAAITEAYRNA